MVARATIADYEAMVAQVARDKGLDEQTAAIHAAPLFYAKYGVKPGDLSRRKAVSDYQWQLGVKGGTGTATTAMRDRKRKR